MQELANQYSIIRSKEDELNLRLKALVLYLLQSKYIDNHNDNCYTYTEGDVIKNISLNNNMTIVINLITVENDWYDTRVSIKRISEETYQQFINSQNLSS